MSVTREPSVANKEAYSSPTAPAPTMVRRAGSSPSRQEIVGGDDMEAVEGHVGGSPRRRSDRDDDAPCLTHMRLASIGDGEQVGGVEARKAVDERDAAGA